MSEFKGTKGAWRIINNITAPKMNLDDCIVIDCNQAPIAIITDNWIPEGMNEANAKLISAAPDLLAALKETIGHEGYKKYIEGGITDAMAKAAIKKATE